MVKSHNTVRHMVTRVAVTRPLSGEGDNTGRPVSMDEVRMIFETCGWAVYRNTWKKAVHSWAHLGYCTIDEANDRILMHCNQYGEYKDLAKHCRLEILEGQS